MRSPSPAARGGAATALQSATIKMGVHFHHKISIKTFSSHRGWPRDLKSQCWYTIRDFQVMRDECLQLIKSPGADWEGLLAQGLEAPQRYRTRREVIKNAKLAVLMEQERSRRVGYQCSEHDLSHRSEWATHGSRVDALWRASIVASQVHRGQLSCSTHENVLILKDSRENLGGRSMSLDELEMSFEPPPSKTRKRVLLLQECYIYPVVHTGACLDHDEERQTMESTEMPYEPHKWHPASVDPDRLSDPFSFRSDDCVVDESSIGRSSSVHETVFETPEPFLLLDNRYSKS